MFYIDIYRLLLYSYAAKCLEIRMSIKKLTWLRNIGLGWESAKRKAQAETQCLSMEPVRSGGGERERELEWYGPRHRHLGGQFTYPYLSFLRVRDLAKHGYLQCLWLCHSESLSFEESLSRQSHDTCKI